MCNYKMPLKKTTINNNSGSSSLFPWKLHNMLQTTEAEGKDSIVSWLPNGKAFKVHNSTRFVSDILPSFFKQTKYKSFQRQLNLWGFKRITGSGRDSGAYSHQFFLKDQPSLCIRLCRQKHSKKNLVARKQMNTVTNKIIDTAAVSKDADSNENIQVDDLSSVDPIEISLLEDINLTGPLDAFVQEQNLVQPAESTEPVCFEGCSFFLLDTDQENEAPAKPLTAPSHPSPTSVESFYDSCCSSTEKTSEAYGGCHTELLPPIKTDSSLFNMEDRFEWEITDETYGLVPQIEPLCAM